MNDIVKFLVESILGEKEIIPGGLAKGKSLQDIADKHKVTIEDIKSQLKKGIKVEMEHTSSKEVAKEIATDHLWEDPKYYEKLAYIEKNEVLNEVVLTNMSYDIDEIYRLITSKDIDFEVIEKLPYPYENQEYIPLLDDNGKPLINGEL